MNLALITVRQDTIGALPPPPNIESNFINPFSLYDYVLSTVILFFIIVPICILARLYTNSVVIRKVSVDDCERPFPPPEVR